ncbi:MAG TPA: ATP-dependent RecD-like DNA helicase [Thermoanaerobaculia bacterium]|jgi:exodeoxyribonuclease V alpha subunit|nr:ATP-dependent RecD-like DNA helicase [Thermoanaerobaculia bacterium]
MTLPFGPPAAGDHVETLQGAIERIVFHNPENGWTVLRLTISGAREPTTVVGTLAGIRAGETLRLEGKFLHDPKFGRQFRAHSFQTVAPSTLTGMERYLASGMIRGVGGEMAKRIVALFGLETLDVIERSPERLTEVSGIGRKRSADIRKAWDEQRGIRELMVFLQSHGVQTGHAVKIYKRYGSDALAVVREDPFRLATDVFGIGFKTADRIAFALGLPADAPRRLEAGLLHALAEASDRGHLFLPRERLFADSALLLGSPDPALLAQALAEISADGRAVVEESKRESRIEGETAVYLAALYAAETDLAERLRRLLLGPPPPGPLNIDPDRALAWLGARQGIELAPQQSEAIRRSLASPLLVITGGPGTGKTTLIRGLVSILTKKGLKIALAAPTGRAAKRLSEATGAEASTIHRLLEFDPRLRRFQRGPDLPLEAEVTIVDEASMIDAQLACHLARALPARGRLILVGDVDQLPSVGPGSVLGDLIRSGAVDVVRLTEIFRQAEKSAIVVNAHQVNRGEIPVSGPAGSDFFIIERREPEEILKVVVQMVAERIPASFGFDPFTEIQVLAPMNRGLLGTERLNAELRARLNPHGASIERGGRVLRVGDKVMQIRNNYDLEVWNGDLGRISRIDDEESKVFVSFDGREVEYDLSILDELQLAYACTIHKSQGSEYPCVVVPLHSQHHLLLQRNLLYTALTRARKLAVLVGEPRALAAAVANRRSEPRFSRLAERLRG